MKKVGVIGTGYVGLTHGVILAEKGNSVICYDIDPEKISRLQRFDIPIYEPGIKELVKKNCEEKRLEFTSDMDYCISSSDIIFVCVNTPPKRYYEGVFRRADLSFVENVARTIAQTMKSYKVIVSKSTVPVMTGKKIYETISKFNNSLDFDVVSNPEFLREGSAVKDSLNPDRIVIGVMKDSSENLLERPLKIMKELYSNFNAKIVETDLWSAELDKLLSNTYLSLQISFINKAAELCSATGADVSKIAESMKLDKRIGPFAFLRAGIGYGGSCFPKDIENLGTLLNDYHIDPSLFEQVIKINKGQRDGFIKLMECGLWTLKGKSIAVLGLSFKPDTGDMREAPSIDIVRALCDEGAIVRVYDPEALSEAGNHFGNSVSYCKSVEEAVYGADAIALLTEWDEFKTMDLQNVKSLMKEPSHFFDGRNVFDPSFMSGIGFYYYSIGRPYIKPVREVVK